MGGGRRAADEVSRLGGAAQDELADDDLDNLYNFVPSAPGAPRVRFNGPYLLTEGGAIEVNASAEDLEGDTMTYEWDLDDDGDVRRSDRARSPRQVSAAAIDGPSNVRLGLRVTDSAGHVSERHLNVARAATRPRPSARRRVATATTGAALLLRHRRVGLRRRRGLLHRGRGPPGMTVNELGPGALDARPPTAAGPTCPS